MQRMSPTADAARSPRPVLLRRKIRWMLAAAARVRFQAQAAPLPPTPAQTEGPFYPRTLPEDRDADLIASGSRRSGAGDRLLFRRSRADAGRPPRRRRERRALAGRPVRPLSPRRRRRAAARRRLPGLWRRDDGRGRAIRVHDDPPGCLRREAAHLHLKVRAAGRAPLTTQIYITGDRTEGDFVLAQLSQGHGGTAVDVAVPSERSRARRAGREASTSCCGERRGRTRRGSSGRQWIVALEKKRSSAPDFSR